MDIKYEDRLDTGINHIEIYYAGGIILTWIGFLMCFSEVMGWY